MQQIELYTMIIKKFLDEKKNKKKNASEKKM